MILKISLRAKGGVPKTLLEQKHRLNFLYFPQNTLMLTESREEFSDLHSIFRLRALCYWVASYSVIGKKVLPARFELQSTYRVQSGRDNNYTTSPVPELSFLPAPYSRGPNPGGRNESPGKLACKCSERRHFFPQIG